MRNILQILKNNKALSALVFFAILIHLYLILAAWLPGRMDRKFNLIASQPPYQSSERAQKLYDSLEFIADLHSDSLLWNRNLNKKSNRGAMDVDRMLQARLSLQNFTIVNKVPNDIRLEKNDSDTDQLILPMIFSARPLRSWFSPAGRVLVQSQDFLQYVKESKNRLRLIQYREDVQELAEDYKATNHDITSGMLGIEGLQALEGKLKNLDTFYEAGVRTLGLVHFFDNKVAGSAHGIKKGGLTAFGRQVIRRIHQKQMIVDLAHASSATIQDVLKMSKRPAISSHTGVKATCNNPRNLTDRELRAIAKPGGLIGIAFFKHAVCGDTAHSIALAIKHAIGVVGARAVALGSDFDGAIKMPFEVRGLPLLVDAMLNIGITEHDIRLIMGVNIRDFLIANLPPRPPE